MPYDHCGGKHQIYVAEVVYVQSEGKLWVVTVCRDCDTVSFHEKQIARPHVEASLIKNEQKEKE